MEQRIVRYASAIVSIARDEKKIKEYKAAFFELFDVMNSNKDVKRYLESYFVKIEDKYKMIDELCSSFKLEGLTNFLKLITKKHLIFRFNDIFRAVNKLMNEELGIDEGFVYSTEALSEERIAQIEDAISKRLGHRVELKNRIDESLIGGVKVVVRDHVYDGTIKTKLASLKENLKERRNG